jgi:hypothetical protein
MASLTLRIFAPWRLCVRLPVYAGRFHAKAQSRKENPQSKTLLWCLRRREMRRMKTKLAAIDLKKGP